MRRGPDGKFVREHQEWDLDNFDDGYVDGAGRFRVYKPSHHRASSGGYVLRSIVAYEEYHGVKVTIEFNVHHKDHNRLNDTIENLELIEHTEHAKIHNPYGTTMVDCVCVVCKKVFSLPQWRINEGKGKYCSMRCVYDRNKNKGDK